MTAICLNPTQDLDDLTITLPEHVRAEPASAPAVPTQDAELTAVYQAADEPNLVWHAPEGLHATAYRLPQKSESAPERFVFITSMQLRRHIKGGDEIYPQVFVRRHARHLRDLILAIKLTRTPRRPVSRLILRWARSFGWGVSVGVAAIGFLSYLA